MDIDGLTRSTTDSRDRARQRVLALTAATGVAAVGASGALLLALNPAASLSATSTAVSSTTTSAPTSTTSTTSSATTDSNGTSASGTTNSSGQAVATSGSS